MSYYHELTQQQAAELLLELAGSLTSEPEAELLTKAAELLAAVPVEPLGYVVTSALGNENFFREAAEVQGLNFVPVYPSHHKD